MSRNNTFTIPQNVDPYNKKVTKVANDLNDVDDVVIAAPQYGDVLFFDGDQWVNKDTNTEFLLGMLGKVTLKEGYNAVTGTPDLSDPGIEKGDMYWCSVAGNFLGYPLTVHDLLIAKVDAPSAAEDWVYINQYVETEIVIPSHPTLGTIDLAQDYFLVHNHDTGVTNKYLLSNLDFFALAGVQAALDSHVVDGNSQVSLQKGGSSIPGAVDLVPRQLYVHSTTGNVYTKTDGGAVVSLASLSNPLPAGGDIGQVLGKVSAADNDVTWLTVGDIGTPSNEYCLGYTYGSTGAHLVIQGFNATHLMVASRRLKITINGVTGYYTVTGSSYNGSDTTVTTSPSIGVTAPSEVCMVAGVAAWSLIASTPLSPEDATLIATGQVTGSQYYVVAGTNGTLSWSSDRGATWNTPSVGTFTSDFTDLQYGSTYEAFIARNSEGIWVSYDGGDTWASFVNLPNNQEHFIITDTYVAVGSGSTIYYANYSDPNAAWSTNTSGDVNTGAAYVCIRSNRTADFGSLWNNGNNLYRNSMTSINGSDSLATILSSAFSTGEFPTCIAQNPTNGALFGTNFGQLFYTSDPTAFAGYAAVVHPLTGLGYAILGATYSTFLDAWIVVAENGNMMYSNDECVTWTLIANGFNLYDIYSVCYNEVDKIFMAVGQASSISKSTTGQN
jgi:hypothetical protein